MRQGIDEYATNVTQHPIHLIDLGTFKFYIVQNILYLPIVKSLFDNMNEYTELTEGEKFIEEFFIEQGITYVIEKEIRNLKGDIKEYRRADFYLPKFKVYVEFLGKWNVSASQKERYREKKKVYEENNIPCVYLYPENLGFLKYAFNYRIRQILIQRKNIFDLLRFNHYQFNQKNTLKLFFALFAVGYILNMLEILDSIFILIFLFYLAIFAIISIFEIASDLIQLYFLDIRRSFKKGKKYRNDF
jgi:hypothetical protein